MKKNLLATRESFCNTLPAPASGNTTISSYKIILSLTVLFFFGSVLNIEAQDDAAYKKTLTERSAKIINTLSIEDSNKYNLVLNEVVNQYFLLNQIHDTYKKAVSALKESRLDENEKKETIKGLEEKKTSQLLQQHTAFISLLNKQLSDKQVEQIKNGMTYNVLNVTYTAYQEMIPSLTTVQKEKIYNWLIEAREKAMDEGSSDDKHKMFGKYKGKINNYLSAEGYDMKAEEKAWQQRIKERKEKTNSK